MYHNTKLFFNTLTTRRWPLEPYSPNIIFQWLPKCNPLKCNEAILQIRLKRSIAPSLQVSSSLQDWCLAIFESVILHRVGTGCLIEGLQSVDDGLETTTEANCNHQLKKTFCTNDIRSLAAPTTAWTLMGLETRSR